MANALIGGLHSRGRPIALVLATLWAAFWTAYLVLEALSIGLTPEPLLSLLFIGSVAVAWRWPRAGGLLLLAEGLIVLIGYAPSMPHMPANTVIFVLLTLGVPPFIAGILLLTGRPRSA